MDPMQNQHKTLVSQQLLDQVEEKNVDAQVQNNEDLQINDSKVEEENKSLGAHQCKNGEEDEKLETVLEENIDWESTSTSDERKKEGNEGEFGTRERLKKHKTEVAGHVWIPDIWGQEEFLKDWIDYKTFDACLVPQGVLSARASLIEEGRRASSRGLRVQNSC